MKWIICSYKSTFLQDGYNVKVLYKMHENIQKSDKRYALDSSLIMRPSSLGGGRILRRTLSVSLSVRPVNVAIGYVFSAPLASRRAT